MESKLKKSEQWLATILRSIGDAVIATDTRGLITFMNPVAKVLTGWKKEDALGKDLTEVFNIIDEKKHTLTESPAMKAIREGAVVPTTNYTLVAKDKAEVSIDYIAALTRDDRENITGVVLVFRDITERRKAEEKIRSYQKKLRSLASKLTIAEEQERRQLAVELHDSIGQLLALSKMKLGQLREVTGPTDVITRLQEFLDQAVQKVRSLTFQLSPPMLYELGLEAALQRLCEEMHERHGIQVTLRMDSQSNLLDNELSIFLFRAVRELLMNVVKHAQVHKVQISLRRKGESLHISVEDRGVGFDPSTLEVFSDRSSRFGLFSIRERLQYFRGEMVVVSQLGQGNRVTLVVPLRAPKKSTGGT